MNRITTSIYKNHGSDNYRERFTTNKSSHLVAQRTRIRPRGHSVTVISFLCVSLCFCVPSCFIVFFCVSLCFSVFVCFCVSLSFSVFVCFCVSLFFFVRVCVS